MVINAHTSIIGETGYNCHSRNFFKALNKLCPVKVRNWTIGSTWSGYNDEPHNGEYYMDDELKSILSLQSLHTPDGVREFPMYSNHGKPEKPSVHIVLNDNLHPYFSDDYPSPSIAYNVWETTRQPDDFFEKLKKFDQVWVPSEWQRGCTIEQGIPADRVKVVPEGVDVDLYQPLSREIKRSAALPFRFLIVGRWEYRKSTKEMIQAWIETFPEDATVELLLNVDNPFANDGLTTTEERLERFNLSHPKIKILSHLSKDEYVRLLKEVDVFISCSRGEGWNLPLIEAMSCGIPSIYSNWGAQLQFAEGLGIPVKVIGEVPAAVDNVESWNPSTPGNFSEPDFSDLSIKLNEVYLNFEKFKKKAILESDLIREKFTWENSAKIAKNTLDELINARELSKKRATSVILSRADTPRRRELLMACIKSLDTDIILSTNYPVDAEIQSAVDHVVFEKENPILNKEEFSKYGVGYYRWYLDASGERIYQPYEYEHSYAAYRLARAGLEKASSLGKKIIHIINYDYEISKDTILSNEKLLNNSDLVMYRQNDWTDHNSAYCSSFISGKLYALLDYFTKYDSREDYYTSMEGFNILEINLAAHYTNSNFEIVDLLVNDLSLTNKVNQEAAGNIDTPYQDKLTNSFKSLSDSAGSDKTTYHKYHEYYPIFLEKFRTSKINLFEIGIDEGKSLKLWEQYFPFAYIWGMDISKEYSSSRCKIFIGDQSKIEDLRRVSSQIPMCDVIVDDGSHVPEHQLKTFYYLFQHKLNWGGVYIIEDIECSYWKPDSEIYGYEAGYLNLVDYFTKLNHEVQYHYSDKPNPLNIHSITYGENCIIIQKKEKSIDGLKYRFSQYLGDLPNSVTDSANSYDQVNINFVDGPFIEIKGARSKNHKITFIDSSNDEIVYSTDISNSGWAKSSRKWFTDWVIRVEDETSTIEYKYDPCGKRVYISLDSKALGDTLAWFPYVEEFRKKWNCEVICSTFWNYLFVDTYPEIKFIQPGEIAHDIYAMYRIGWYYTDSGINYEYVPRDFKSGPLQRTATDILGLEFKEAKPLITYSNRKRLKKIGLGINSTTQAKYWNNPNGWQEVVDWLLLNGYEPIILSREEDGYMGNDYPIGAEKFPSGPIQEVIEELAECEAFIGISSGLTWLAWATDTPTIQISGFTEPFNEPDTDIIKISAPDGVCSGCANRLRLDAGNWNWCPDQAGTSRQFECSKLIESAQVIEKIKTLLN